jgi:dTDP-4-amino-4,6-dideoxygalactose transaminase
MERLKDFGKNRGIFVVEDAAQAMGGTYKDKMIGTVSDVGFFSLGRGKNLTCGSGGIILTNSESIAGLIKREYSNLHRPSVVENIKKLLKAVALSIFIHPSLYWFPAGLSSLKLGETLFYRDFPVTKLSGMQAGLLNNWQRTLEEANKIRGENAADLNNRSSQNKKSFIPYLRLPVMIQNRERKERILSLSQRKGLGISRMYPTPVSEIKEIRNQFNGTTYPSAKILAETLLTLPTHPLLKEKDREEIRQLFRELSLRGAEGDEAIP